MSIINKILFGTLVLVHGCFLIVIIHRAFAGTLRMATVINCVFLMLLTTSIFWDDLKAGRYTVKIVKQKK